MSPDPSISLQTISMDQSLNASPPLSPHLSVSLQTMSKDQCDSVAVSVESLLTDAVKMQSQCRERSEQLAVAAAALREESACLREQVRYGWMRRLFR